MPKKLSKKQSTPKKVTATKKGHPKTQRSSNLLIVSGVVAVFVFLSISALAVYSLLNQPEDTAASLTPRTNKNIGIMNFNWTDIVPGTSEAYKPAEGYKVVAVNTEILNLSRNSVWLAPAIESYITDTSGTHYGMALAEVTNPFTAGVYKPQQLASGQLTYAVPDSSQDQSWCYELADSNGGGVPICLPLNSITQGDNSNASN